MSTDQATDLRMTTKVLILDDFLDDGFGTAQSGSLPNLEAIEDSTADEQKQKHDLYLHCEKN